MTGKTKFSKSNGNRSVFTCRQCGECCHGQGGILVTPEETERLAAFFQISREEFQRTYLVDSALGPQVATGNGACVFFMDNRCQVHPVKPRICREWPFLQALLKHADEFEAAKEACPGIELTCTHAEFIEYVKDFY
jgi:Fe-S-cluster containining protein